MRDMLENVHMDDVLSFLRDKGLYLENKTLFIILENSTTQLTNQLSTNELLLNSNTWNR